MIPTSNNALLQFNGSADRRYTKPNLRLVNKVSLDKVLKTEIYVNEADGQLWAAHLILGYTPYHPLSRRRSTLLEPAILSFTVLVLPIQGS